MQRLNPHTGNEAAFAQLTYNITQAHSILGQMHDAMMHKVCKHLNWKLTQGTLKPCEACAIGKACQHNLENHHSDSSEIGEQWYINGMRLKKTPQSKGPFPSNNSTTSTQYEHLCGELPKFICYMHSFGKAGTLKDYPENSTKSRKRGITCMFVGYVPTSSGNCAVLVDPNNCFQRYKLCAMAVS